MTVIIVIIQFLNKIEKLKKIAIFARNNKIVIVVHSGFDCFLSENSENTNQTGKAKIFLKTTKSLKLSSINDETTITGARLQP